MSDKLPNERSLEDAEATLQVWATILAEDGLDTDAAEALRVANTILKFRMGFMDSAKTRG